MKIDISTFLRSIHFESLCPIFVSSMTVASLVSFLPQDRVGEFASLNGRPLLECVLQAVDSKYYNLLM